MNKMWLVIRNEYIRHVFRKRFLFSLLSLPFFIVIIGGVSVLAAFSQFDRTPIGFVDLSGVLANPQFPPEQDGDSLSKVKILPFSTEADAQSALDQKQIQAFYVLEPDYSQTGNIQQIAFKQPGSTIESQFMQFLRYNLLSSQPSEIRQRLFEGSQVVVRSLDGTQELSERSWYNIVIPLMAGILFIVVLLTSGGYLMEAVVEEKENRTMEIIVTSISPNQLMTGKIIGNIAVGLTQLVVWLVFVVVGIILVRIGVPAASDLRLDGGYLLIQLLTFLPAFIMVAAFMATIGATVTATREAQQISGLFTLPIIIPYYFMQPLMENPNGGISLFLSFFPLTAPVALTLRAGFTQIPTWQLVLNLAVLWLFAIGALWLAARAFRMGMLRYGKRLTLREIFRFPNKSQKRMIQ
jgi:ABC-2 type transport system permease protein